MLMTLHLPKKGVQRGETVRSIMGGCCSAMCTSCVNMGGTRASTVAPISPPEAPATPAKITDSDILSVFRSCQLRDGVLKFMGRSRQLDEAQLAVVKGAIDLLDDDSHAAAGKWTSSELSWSDVQASAASTLLMPSTIDQGDTTTCAAITVLEAMAMFRPVLYAKLVLAVWRGKVVDHEGNDWGDDPELKPALLAANPALSIESPSKADWMVASAVIAELRDQSFFRDLLGHDDYLGQDAFGPDGKTVDHARGLTPAWEVRRISA